MNADAQNLEDEAQDAITDPSRPRGDKIKIAIADDHQLVRQALRLYLASFPDLECVGEAHDGAEAVLLVQRKQVDVLVLDLRMPRVNGVEAIRRLRSLPIKVKVVVFSSDADRLPADIREDRTVAVRLKKGSDPEDLIRAIRYAAQPGGRED